MDLSSLLWLSLLAPVAFIQNMFFTLVSRSRNSNDPGYHRYCAWGSNGVWFICQVLIVKNIWSAIHAGQWWYAILAGIVYSLATTEGSVLMMKRLIKTEKGKRRVGGDKVEKLEADLKYMEADLKFQESELKFLRDIEDNTYERLHVLERMIINGGMKSLELLEADLKFLIRNQGVNIRDIEDNIYERLQVLELMIINGQPHEEIYERIKSLERQQSEMTRSLQFTGVLTDAISTKEIG